MSGLSWWRSRFYCTTALLTPNVYSSTIAQVSSCRGNLEGAEGKKYWHNQKKEFACNLIFLKILTRGIDHTFSHSEQKKFGEQNYKGCKKNYSVHILNYSVHIFSHVPSNFTLFYPKNRTKMKEIPPLWEYLLFSIQIYNIFPRNPNAPQAG